VQYKPTFTTTIICTFRNFLQLQYIPIAICYAATFSICNKTRRDVAASTHKVIRLLYVVVRSMTGCLNCISHELHRIRLPTNVNLTVAVVIQLSANGRGAGDTAAAAAAAAAAAGAALSIK